MNQMASDCMLEFADHQHAEGPTSQTCGGTGPKTQAKERCLCNLRGIGHVALAGNNQDFQPPWVR